MSDGTPGDMAELETLLGQSGKTVAGVMVQPLKVVQLPGFIRALQPLLDDIAGRDGLSPAALAWACTSHPEAVLAAVSIATAVLPADLSDRAALDAAIAGRAAWLAGQGLDVLLELVVAVVEVNGDFFLQSPALASLSRMTAGASTSQP